MRSLLWMALLTLTAVSAPLEIVVTGQQNMTTIKVPKGAQLVIKLDPIHHTDIKKRVWGYVPGRRLDNTHLKFEGVDRSPNLEVFRYRVLASGKKTLLGLDYCCKQGDGWERPPLKEFMIEVETP